MSGAGSNRVPDAIVGEIDGIPFWLDVRVTRKGGDYSSAFTRVQKARALIAALADDDRDAVLAGLVR